MPSILKQEKKSMLKRRNVSHLSVNIETVQENKVSFAKLDSMEGDTVTRNEGFFFSVWPGKLLYARVLKSTLSRLYTEKVAPSAIFFR